MDGPVGEAADDRGRLRAFHADHGATFETVGGVEVVAHYGRPTRAGRAVRNGVGVVEVPADVIVLTGEDRRAYLDNLLTASVPAEDGRGCYALLLDPQGRIETDLVVYAAADRLLAFAPPGVAAGVVDGWETFIQDVEIAVATEAFAVFGVHGPAATEKVAGVLHGASAPDERFAFVRGSIADAGVTVCRTDAPAGETGYEVVCAAGDAADVADALLTLGPNAVPFGQRTWDALTLEAGTPRFETELSGRIPNVVGARSAVDFEKGCFPGQEIVSKVENRGRPSQRLVGLVVDGDAPAPGASVSVDGDGVGAVTRASESPSRETPVAFAAVDFGLEATDVAVETDAGPAPATVEAFPLVEGAERSGRIPDYG